MFKGTEESNYISLQMPLCSVIFLGLGYVSSLTLTVYKPTLALLNKGRTVACPGGPRVTNDKTHMSISVSKALHLPEGKVCKHPVNSSY